MTYCVRPRASFYALVFTLLFTLLFARLLDPIGASAHDASDAHLSLDLRTDPFSARWDLALRDLEITVGLDRDGDSAITWDELRAAEGRVFAHALERLQITTSGKPCETLPTNLRVDRHVDGTYAVLEFEVACATRPQTLEVDYAFLRGLDARHRGLFRLETHRGTRTAIFSATDPSRSIDLGSETMSRGGFLEFVVEGMRHLADGLDHLLFLACLLLPSVLTRDAGQWRPVRSIAEAARNACLVVTAFTASHSLTLGLASLGWLDLPTRWVESAIAASIVLAALENLLPHASRPRVAMAFAFGLVHGLGFASVLADLELPADVLMTSLLGFNLGVELGQLCFVAIFLPLAYGASRRPAYTRFGLSLGSIAILIVGSVWLAERALDRSITGDLVRAASSATFGAVGSAVDGGNSSRP